MNRERVPRSLNGRTIAGAAVATALVASAPATADNYLSPPFVQANQRQVFTLAVQTEKENEGIPIAMVELFVPADFSIDSFAPTQGWEQDWTIQRVQKATWSRDEEDLTDKKEKGEAAEHDAFFEFFGRPAANKTYTFTVRQTYSDGSVVQWGPKVEWPGNPKTSEGPGPAVVAQASIGGGGTSTLAIVALIVGALALLVGAGSLVTARAR